MTDQMIDVGGARLWLTSSGTGPPVLMASGGPGCCDYMQPIAEMIDDMAQVWRFEQRGCGRSDPCETYDLATTVADLEVLRQHLGIEQWTMVGHSWGGQLALIYALHHPERVQSFISISGGRFFNDAEAREAYHRNKEVCGEREPDYLFPPNMEVNRQLNPSIKAYVRQPWVMRAVADLPTPALFIAATNDIRPNWTIEQIALLMPNAQYTEIEGAEHTIWHTHGSELRDKLRDYLAGVLSGGA